MPVGETKIGFPVSLLDTDLYKLTMQQAILRHFPNTQATYRFYHRDKGRHFSAQCVEQFQAAVKCFSELVLTTDELKWLKSTCPYFTEDYLDYLAGYRFKPEQVNITFHPVPVEGDHGNLEIEATGSWAETIFWEVPLMACLSEIFFRTDLTDWSYEGHPDIIYKKAEALLNAGCVFSEFGTRRRRSYYIQDLVVRTLIQAAQDDPGKGKFAGTSNVYLAMKYNVKPVGTIAHEWFMGIAALKGYEQAHSNAMELWESVYPDNLLITLTDTFTTEAFFAEFVKNPDRARRWRGLRQDSGDPFVLAPRARDVYESMGIDHREKFIVYSDNLNLEKALGLKKQCDELGFPTMFGIGTFLTNDFMTASSGGVEKSKALNMVIKIAFVDERPCIKLSDDLDKNTGDPSTVKTVKKLLGVSK